MTDVEPRYPTAAELVQMPTLRVGHTADLKYEADGLRVWLSRCTVADGEPWENTVYVEVNFSGRWVMTRRYPGGET